MKVNDFKIYLISPPYDLRFYIHLQNHSSRIGAGFDPSKFPFDETTSFIRQLRRSSIYLLLEYSRVHLLTEF